VSRQDLASLLVKTLLLFLAGYIFLVILWNIKSATTLEPHYKAKGHNVPQTPEENKLPEFKPYSGVLSLEINPIVSLNGMSLQEISDFRIKEVNKYHLLNIFPPNYDPLKPPHNKIYRSINSGAEWLHPAQFYLCNPYLLIVLTCARHVTPLATFCNNIEIEYSDSSIEEIYKGDNAFQWYQMLYAYEDYPGIVRIWMVNAYDAGLFYARIDKKRSANIDYNWSKNPENIVNSIYSQPGIFHKGRYSKNNLSPKDTNGRIKLLKKDAYTCIYVKLWRKKPNSEYQNEDLAYIIKINPEP